MWLAQVESEGHGLIEDELLTAEEQGDEFLLMGLRLREGIDPARFRRLSGRASIGGRSVARRRRLSSPKTRGACA